jgi:hypothetical protein
VHAERQLARVRGCARAVAGRGAARHLGLRLLLGIVVRCRDYDNCRWNDNERQASVQRRTPGAAGGWGDGEGVGEYPSGGRR